MRQVFIAFVWTVAIWATGPASAAPPTEHQVRFFVVRLYQQARRGEDILALTRSFGTEARRVKTTRTFRDWARSSPVVAGAAFVEIADRRVFPALEVIETKDSRSRTVFLGLTEGSKPGTLALFVCDVGPWQDGVRYEPSPLYPVSTGQELVWRTGLHGGPVIATGAPRRDP